jgi:hypothetical protein
MERQRYIDLFKGFVIAVKYCNEKYEQMGEEGLPSDDLQGVFTTEFFPMVFCPACADGIVTEDELKRINEILAPVGASADEEIARKAMKIVEREPFKSSSILIPYVLKAFFLYMDAPADEKETVLKEAFETFDWILDFFAEVMFYVVDQVGEAEKCVISACLSSMCQYISETMPQEYTLPKHIRDRF